MTFEGQYLTKADYRSLGGSAMEDMPFNLLEFESRKRIDLRTQNRLKNAEYNDIPQEVKVCVYNLINSIKEFANTTTATTDSNIASESTDGYSVSYLTADKISEVVKSKSDELDDIIRTYLLTTKYNNQYLMYAGVK